MAEKLYLPGELGPTRFLREGGRYLIGRDLCARAPELRAVTGEEQFQLLWDNQDKIPESWKNFWGLLVPDPETGVVRVLYWNGISERWDRYECGLLDDFRGSYRVLLPRELSS